MTELSFAKSFLTTLDSRPNKISADHVEDPKTYPPRNAYILPKSSHPIQKKIKLTPGAERSFEVILKSIRNPPLDITLPSLPLSTSILSLKETVSSQTSIPVSKLRLLYSKKPAPDSKVLKDLVGEESGSEKVEFSIMVIGGAASLTAMEEEKEPKVIGDADGVIGEGRRVISTEEFWTDLRGFLVQRLKDEKEGDRLWRRFRELDGSVK